MTFSIAARDPETGAFGLAVTTSGLSVGSRCPYAKAGIGAVLTQHRTDPRLGPLGLQLLSRGLSAEETLAALVADRYDAKWRQVAVVDAAGRTAAYHGSEIYSFHGHASRDGAIAIGNILRSEALPDTMLDRFLTDAGEPLELRLVGALEAGLEAGGELGALKSAALLIVRDDEFAWMDLRVDRSADPVAELRTLAVEYAPVATEFQRRVLLPETVPDDATLVKLHKELLATGT